MPNFKKKKRLEKRIERLEGRPQTERRDIRIQKQKLKAGYSMDAGSKEVSSPTNFSTTVQDFINKSVSSITMLPARVAMKPSIGTAPPPGGFIEGATPEQKASWSTYATARDASRKKYLAEGGTKYWD
jgi:hypothetical protein